MTRSLIEWSRHIPRVRRAFDWIDPSKRREIVRAFGSVKRRITMKAALAGRTANLADIEAFLVPRATPLRLPLVLVSQVQRSGGTLLSQLFDGHPALAAHPHELKIGHPTPEDWPPIGGELSADANFRMLFEARTIRFMKKGYTKGERENDGQACFIVPSLQWQIFSGLFEANQPKSRREILDLFFTAYFRAWLNYQGDLEQKRFFTGFAPRFANSSKNVSAFFESYPDGLMIQIVRDPRSWLPSARFHGRAGVDPDDTEGLLSVWSKSTEAVLQNRATYGSRLIVLVFDRLVGQTEQTMRHLAHQLGIDYDAVLLEPTFNGRKMTANSSFPVETSGIVTAPLQREKLLSGPERQLIERNLALYDRAVALDKFGH